MKRSNIILFLFVLMVAHASLAEEAVTMVSGQGQTTLAASNDKHSVRVLIGTRKVEIGKPSDERPTEINSICTYSRYPCSVVVQFKILVDGTSIFIPKSVFCDRADLNKAILRAEGKEFTLILYGGDASESYIARIDFDVTRIKRRTISSGIEPGSLLQETIYHEQVVGD